MLEEDTDHQRGSAIRDGMEKQLRFLQDIPPSQRTQRHSTQIEYCIISDKCAKIAAISSHAISQGEPIHVTAAKLGDPVALHALLARMYFLSQVELPCTRT